MKNLPRQLTETSHSELQWDPANVSQTSSYVIRAMRERVQLCQDPQAEFALLRESLGVSRINHSLGVQDHTILH